MTIDGRAFRVMLRVVSLLLLVLQGGLACASVPEGSRGIGRRAHVESTSAARHFAHNESECAVCTVRSAHATARVWPAEARDGAGTRAALALARVQAPTMGARWRPSSRAPPRPAIAAKV